MSGVGGLILVQDLLKEKVWLLFLPKCTAGPMPPTPPTPVPTALQLTYNFALSNRVTAKKEIYAASFSFFCQFVTK